MNREEALIHLIDMVDANILVGCDLLTKLKDLEQIRFLKDKLREYKQLKEYLEENLK